MKNLPVDQLDLAFEIGHRLDDVGVGLAPGGQSHDRPTLAAHEAHRLLESLHDGGHVPHEHRPSIIVSDYRVFDVPKRDVLANRAVAVIALARCDRSGGTAFVLLAQGFLDIAEGQAASGQPMRVEHHLHFAVPTAVDGNFTDPLSPFEDRFDVILDEGLEARDVHSLLGIEDHPGNGQFHAIRRGGNRGLVHFLRIPADLAQLVRHVPKGGVLVDSHRELQLDLRLVPRAFRATLLKAADVLEFLFLTLDNLALDLLGAGADPSCRHRDDRAIHVGRKLNAHPRQTQQAREYQQDDADGYLHGVFDGETNQTHQVPSALLAGPFSRSLCPLPSGMATGLPILSTISTGVGNGSMPSQPCVMTSI